MKVTKQRMMELNAIGLHLKQRVTDAKYFQASKNDRISMPFGYLEYLLEAYMEMLDGVEVETEGEEE